MENQFVVEQQQGIFPTDALLNTSPLSNKDEDIYNPAQISDKFSSLTYNKGTFRYFYRNNRFSCLFSGGSIIRMLKHFLGEEDFKKGLRTYLTNK